MQFFQSNVDSMAFNFNIYFLNLNIGSSLKTILIHKINHSKPTSCPKHNGIRHAFNAKSMNRAQKKTMNALFLEYRLNIAFINTTAST